MFISGAGRGQKKTPDPMQLEIAMAGRYYMGKEPESSARVVSNLNW